MTLAGVLNRGRIPGTSTAYLAVADTIPTDAVIDPSVTRLHGLVVEVGLEQAGSWYEKPRHVVERYIRISAILPKVT